MHFFCLIGWPLQTIFLEKVQNLEWEKKGGLMYGKGPHCKYNDPNLKGSKKKENLQFDEIFQVIFSKIVK